MARNSDPLDDLIAKWEPELRKAFLEAIEGITNRQNIALLARLIEAGDVEGAIRAVGLDPVDFRSLNSAMAAAYSAGGQAFETAIPAVRDQLTGAIVRFHFDVRNPQAEAWARDRSATLITGIISDQQTAIRSAIMGGIQTGTNPRATALDLVGRRNRATGKREGGILGLTAHQEEWQRRYAAELSSTDPKTLREALQRGLRDKRFDGAVRKAIRTGEPIPAETVSRMLVQYRNRSLKYRADLIAKQESLTAFAASEREGYRQGIEKGHIQAQDIKRFARTAGDERVRWSHAEIPKMNPDGVGFDEPFQTPVGPRKETPFDVGCRCRVIYRLNYARGVR